jgi:predicted NBD/HSP70 family sugar kinase
MKHMQFSAKEVSLLQAAYFLESPTRNEIARDAGLSAVSVTATLNRLIEAGLLHRAGKTSSGSGRPSALYRITPNLGITVGVSIDKGSFRIIAIDGTMRILSEKVFALILSTMPEDHIADIVQQVSLELERMLASDALAGRRLLALGVALPGMVDTERGVWLHGLQVSGITHCNLRDILVGRFKVPVMVEDTARCITWLERSKAGASASEPMVLLYLGDGVGAGIVTGGGLYRGMNGLAGEIGHMHVAEEGDRCPCGNIGCLEMVVSVPSILRRFRRRLEEGVMSSLQRATEDVLDLHRILEAARADDRLARSNLYDLGLVVGDACATLVELHNPRTLLVGGAAGTIGEFFREPINLRLRQRVIPEMLAEVRIDIVPYAPHDESLGAAMIAERNFWQCLDIRAAQGLARSQKELTA